MEALEVVVALTDAKAGSGDGGLPNPAFRAFSITEASSEEVIEPELLDVDDALSSAASKGSVELDVLDDVLEAVSPKAVRTLLIEADVAVLLLLTEAISCAANSATNASNGLEDDAELLLDEVESDDEVDAASRPSLK